MKKLNEIYDKFETINLLNDLLTNIQTIKWYYQKYNDTIKRNYIDENGNKETLRNTYFYHWLDEIHQCQEYINKLIHLIDKLKLYNEKIFANARYIQIYLSELNDFHHMEKLNDYDMNELIKYFDETINKEALMDAFNCLLSYKYALIFVLDYIDLR